MATRLVEIHDRCTTPNCGRVLHSIKEGESGLCSTCWFKSLSAEKKSAMNRLIKSAFDGSTEAEKDAAVDEAMKHFKAPPAPGGPPRD